MKDLVPVRTSSSNAFFATAMQRADTDSPESFDEVHMSALGDALDGLEFGVIAAAQSPCATSSTIINSDVQMGPAPKANAPFTPFDAANQPPLDPSVFMTPPSSAVSGKRKAIEDDDSTFSTGRPPHSTKSGDSGKSPRLSMPQALQQMGSNLLNLNSTFERAATALEVTSSNTIARSADPISLRRQKAVQQVQAEPDLGDHQVLNILSKFQSDIAIVDIYLAIEKPTLRKLFLEQLSK